MQLSVKQPECLPFSVKTDICSSCHVPLLPGRTCKPASIALRTRPHKVAVYSAPGIVATKKSSDDEEYKCQICKSTGAVPIVVRNQRKRRRVAEIPAAKPAKQPIAPALPAVALASAPSPTSAPVPPIILQSSPVSLLGMRSLLQVGAPKPNLLTSAAAPVPKASAVPPVAPKPKQQHPKQPQKPAGRQDGKPPKKFDAIVKKELDKSMPDGGPKLQFFM